MPQQRPIHELLALKEIAETLNTLNDMHPMLDAVLQKLLQVTGLTTGWIFLVDEEPEYACVVDHGLPPALCWGGKTPMGEGSCWCLDRYWKGKLNHAVNIIECKRIEDAIELNWGDTGGIVHHATVPLKAGGELFGILNVAAPGKEIFTDEELALLQAVAYQIGTAVKRTRLYHAQQKRAEHYAKLGEVSRRLGSILETDQIPGEWVRQVAKTFDWPSVAFFVREGDGLSLRALCENGTVSNRWRSVAPERAGPIGTALLEGRRVIVSDNRDPLPELEAIGVPAFRSAVAVPLRLRERVIGVLFVGSQKKNRFDAHDADVLAALSDHTALALENARLYAQRREIAKIEERNRLARDLHDSVCQTLFSLALTARGAESAVARQSEIVHQSLREIERLAQDAFKEMRSLIWQLRPAGLEQGLVTALKRYGESLGLVIREQREGMRELPRSVEEALWRIGQESLNNVSKHAGTDQAAVRLCITEAEACLEISDQGNGFTVGKAGCRQSMGMLTMRERAEMLGGVFSVKSAPNRGTQIRVTIPLAKDQAGMRQAYEN
ncbi:GAF domain-containing sensor histidine kinase [Effusibacillus pohliae]|uniref:GAF domain-containing sensor histidine kinase n=1 Tax=Effusibacillus pohliae TaxID=232270 RepID=UPI00035ED7C9|nr:GAF domain-containing sensor histidine kinase [Effusibacillus pohliae]